MALSQCHVVKVFNRLSSRLKKSLMLALHHALSSCTALPCQALKCPRRCAPSRPRCRVSAVAIVDDNGTHIVRLPSPTQ
ncbi:unnamed protein product [Closterium sp. Yama58-4]|nr:unnamed protein product [Closterium sp. Yama58-4]